MRAMKDSGIEWIGEIPTNWDLKKLRHSTVIRDEIGTYTASDIYIGLENIENATGRLIKTESEYGDGIYNIFRDGDVLFNKLRPYLEKAFIAKFDGFCTGELIVFRKFEGDRRFLFYFLLSHGFIQIVNISTYGTKMPRASWEYIKNLPMPLPEQEKQFSIANFLDAKCSKIDHIIELQKTSIEKLKAYKQSVITEAVTKGLNPDAPMKDSGIEWIGEIPLAWIVIKIKYLLEVKKNVVRVGPFGSQIKGDDFKERGYKVFNQRTVLDDDFVGGDVYVDEIKYNELIAFKVEPYDFLITTRGTIGKIAIAPKRVDNGIIHPCIIKFSIERNKVCGCYLKYIFNKTLITVEQFILKSNATTIPVVYSQHLKNGFIPFPSLSEQKEIIVYLNRRCAAIDNTISKKESLIDKLTAYKKSLIYEAVTGKMEI
jgi:type I restriction enzyme S subunit